MFSGNQKIITALDIGGSKITACIARSMPGGKIHILGKASCPSQGIKYGAITDMKLARSSIAAAVYEAERKANRHVDTVVINVSNALIKTSLTKILMHFSGKQILSADLKNIEKSALTQIDVRQHEILEHSVLWHDLDEMLDIHDPEFMFANTLASFVNIVTAPTKYLVNLNYCLLGCPLKISRFVLSGFASALVCTKDEEREAGCMLIDIGGDNLDYVLIKHHKVVNAGSIPLAGKIITRDISQYFALNFAEAEKLKILHGKLDISADGSDDMLKINREEGQTSISKATLNNVIRARFEEIILTFMKCLKKSRANDGCFNNIIFTGGSSKFDGLENFLMQHFNLKVRKGIPSYIDITASYEKEPEFSTVLGMLKHVMPKPQKTPHQKGSIKKALVWLKENF